MINIKDFISSKLILNKGIPMYSDNVINSIKNSPHEYHTKRVKTSKILKFYEYKLSSPRFVKFDYVSQFSELTYFLSNPFSQGVIDNLSWEGLSICKSNEELIIYTHLLQEIPFNSVIELGTGNGNFIKFLKKFLKKNSNILSFDINGNQYYCDLNNLKTLLPYEHKFRKLKSPTLFIDDAHVNTFESLNYFFHFSSPGDYFFIEDCLEKTKFSNVQNFIEKHKNVLFIDSKYTGMFGTFNSIVIKHLKYE